MSMTEEEDKQWWVYVLQSQSPRFGAGGKPLPGFYYVGATTDPPRRLRQHNGEITGGGKYTSQHRPWLPRALYGPYADQSEAMKAEYALKHGKRGVARTQWTPEDSSWCRGEGPLASWVVEADHGAIIQASAPSAPQRPPRRKRRRRRK